MSYWTEILLQVRIPERKVVEVRRELEQPEKYASHGLRMFLSLAELSSANTLEFKASGHDFDSEYCEDDEDLVQALKAQWCDPDDIAAWIARYARRGNRMLIHSLEANGNEFGYEFDGRGRCRCLLLRPHRGWVAPSPVPTLDQLPRRGKSRLRRRINWAKWPRRNGGDAVDTAWAIISGVCEMFEAQEPPPPAKDSTHAASSRSPARESAESERGVHP